MSGLCLREEQTRQFRPKRAVSTQLVWAVVLIWHNKQLLTESEEFILGISPGKWCIHSHVYESTYRLSVMYTMRQGFFSGLTWPLAAFSPWGHWPYSGGFDDECVKRVEQWKAGSHWTQIGNKFGFTPRAIIIQDEKTIEGTVPHPIPWWGGITLSMSVHLLGSAWVPVM